MSSFHSGESRMFGTKPRMQISCMIIWSVTPLGLSAITRHLVLIFSYHVYHQTILTGLWLWTYALSRYLAATSCSLTFLIRITFAHSHCPVPWLPSILYLTHVSYPCSDMSDFFTAYCTYYCASVSTLLHCCADFFCLHVPILYDDFYFNCFT